ncbi:MAG: DEAD/DEAH box helicase [Candidatus Gastranaerophilales bacterium]
MSEITFQQLNLAGFIQEAINKLGFETPTSIQAQAIPHLMGDKDIIAMAPTGSGKTFAFGIPALQKIDITNKEVQVLILCPTRELTMQAHKELEKLSEFCEEINIVSIYGGQRIDKQISALKRNPQIIIATPGRLMDHMRQKTIDIKNIKYVVLDEADEMLDMGFREDINTILEETNKERQTILFSATMEKDIQKIAERFQRTPMIIDVLDDLQNAPNIEQTYLETTEKHKPELITRLLDLYNLSSAIVFCNTKKNVDMLVEVLKYKGFAADAIHGDMNQNQRENIMRGFKKGSIKILVATDVAGRGIDIKEIGAVFNYDLPRDQEDYIHRIGRTGRAGSFGKAFALVTKSQINMLRKIERLNGLKITKQECPSYEELENARVNKYHNNVLEVVSTTDLTDLKLAVKGMTKLGLTELEVAAALYKILTKNEQFKINRQITFEDLGFDYSESEERRGSRGSRGGRGGFGSRGPRVKGFGSRSDKENKSEKVEVEKFEFDCNEDGSENKKHSGASNPFARRRKSRANSSSSPNASKGASKKRDFKKRKNKG